MGRTKAQDRVYQKKYKRDNKEKLAQWRSNRYRSLHGRANNLFNTARRSAKKRGLKFDLTVEWIEEKLKLGLCELTNLTFSFGVRNAYTPSIDRKDSSKGYTKDNCRVILWALNAAFNEWGEGIFQAIAREWIAVDRDKE